LIVSKQVCAFISSRDITHSSAPDLPSSESKEIVWTKIEKDREGPEANEIPKSKRQLG
jgi:hypothetical protein